MLFYSWSIFHFSGVRSSVAVRSKSASERIQVHSDMRRSVLTKSIFCYGVFCPIRQELIFSKKFKRTKTGFERCIMQITIAIKGALSSVTVHSFASLWWQHRLE
ncbi:hypothetical protein T4D_843 [Trichinella pseudospiralis]|uniref:Uncharacterized protein n=1 Tax=Trichinella pseudospiralis TaxID=6337 RepID=A0A0V1FMU0_TRIPS|nr:hypothetical protein T4D_843 [Trichinella pseudospiralis]